MDTARSRGVVLLTIPPHTSHRLQLLDRSVYGPLKTAYNRAIDGWLRSNPGKTVTIYEIPTLVNQAQMIAMTPQNITAGCQATGIHPFNRDIFSETDFAPAAPTDCEQPDAAEDGTEGTLTPDNMTSSDTTPTADLPSDVVQPQQLQTDDTEVNPIPENTTSSDTTTAASLPSDVEQPLQRTTVRPTTSDNPDSPMPSPGYVSPSDVHPFPKATRRKTKACRKKGSTKILTDTPERQELAAIFESRKRKATSMSRSQRDIYLKRRGKSHALPLSPKHQHQGPVRVTIQKLNIMTNQIHYIARVDVLSGDEFEFEGVFLHKVAGKVGSNRPVFVPDTNDEAAFDLEDVVLKLPQPKTVGSSSRCAGQLVFNYDLSEWHLT